MMINTNFVIRDILGTALLFPIVTNPISNEPIYVNNTVHQILVNAQKANNKKELTAIIIDLFCVNDDLTAKAEIDNCIQQLIDIGLLIEENKNGK